MRTYSKSIGIGLAGLSLLLGSQIAIADNVPADRTITLIRTYSTWAAVHFTPAYENDLGCPSPSNFDDRIAIINWGDDSDNKAMYATALGAYMTGKAVGFGISGCWSSYAGGVPLAYRVDVADQ